MATHIFDGHNDTLTLLAGLKVSDPVAQFVKGTHGHIDVPKAQEGGFAGGFFAIWVRSPGPGGFSLNDLKPPYDVPLPKMVDQAEAWEIVERSANILQALDKAGAVRICRTVDEIEAARADGVIAAIMHVEGAEAIGPELSELDRLYDMGLRSLGPVWSRETIFGHGVPFRYPSDGDIGVGLTEAGKALVARSNELKILIDLSHLNAAGIADVAKISDAPLVATHSNAWAVSPHARNLTDPQLQLIADSGGVVGLNFECSFMRPDGVPNVDTPRADAMAQLDYLLDKLGEDGVTLGSDYDGCKPPQWLNRADKLPNLVRAMEQHGYAPERIEKICWGNWMRVLRETWG
ncbi:dipeptidase [Heliomarina baculiformis]|uniref:dipeptidase n=1 Tax=Heliomarina baculiformis TaxID=2872036 RepID=UPI001EE2706E|nr:dipeptidase [Heliomarina baculiformis]